MEDKAFSITLDEFKQNLISVINESKLPICIVELVIKDLYGELSRAAQQPLKIAKDAYEKSLKEEEEK